MRDKGYYVMTVWSIRENHMAVTDIDILTAEPKKYMKRKRTALDDKTDVSTVVARDVNTPFSIKDRKTRQRITRKQRLSTVSPVDLQTLQTS